MNHFSLEIKLIILAVIAATLIGSGIWFRGVLADNKEMKGEIVDLTGEVDRMNKQDAVDYALRQNIEAQKVQLSADLAANMRNLKKAKELLDEATRNCLDLPLPDSYLDRLPQAPR